VVVVDRRTAKKKVSFEIPVSADNGQSSHHGFKISAVFLSLTVSSTRFLMPSIRRKSASCMASAIEYCDPSPLAWSLTSSKSFTNEREKPSSSGMSGSPPRDLTWKASEGDSRDQITRRLQPSKVPTITLGLPAGLESFPPFRVRRLVVADVDGRGGPLW
jgi:hypothetical protein